MMNYDGVVFFKIVIQADKPVSSKLLLDRQSKIYRLHEDELPLSPLALASVKLTSP